MPDVPLIAGRQGKAFAQVDNTRELGAILTSWLYNSIKVLGEDHPAAAQTSSNEDLWGLREFWGPGEVLTCPDICAFFSCL